MLNKTKIALVTGGAGFIGSHMVDLLINKKYIVRVIDNLDGGRYDNLKAHKKSKYLEFFKKDIVELKKNDKLFKNVDYVFHFAGSGDIVPSIEKPEKYINTNLIGTTKVLEASRYSNIKKFVYAASSSCYGIAKVPTNENHKISTEYPYALSKYLGELATLHWCKIYKLPTVSIRIFNAYGPRVRTTGLYGAVFGVFFKQKLENKPFTIVGNGNQKRDFLYVTDVVNAFYLAAKSRKINEIYNLGASKPQSINYLAKIIGGKKIYIPKRPGEPECTWADINKIKKDLNWKPEVSFKDGVKEMLKHIDNWKNAPLWNKRSIKKATFSWFKYLK